MTTRSGNAARSTVCRWTLLGMFGSCHNASAARRKRFEDSPPLLRLRCLAADEVVSFDQGRVSTPMKIAQFSTFGRPEAVVDCVEAADPPAPQAGEVGLTVLAFPINPADLLG